MTARCTEHWNALAAVQSNHIVPRCPDERLNAARGAGLIEFHAWPAGFWRITEAGHEYLAEILA